MDQLVTLSECKAVLRFDHSDDDARLSLLIGAASTSILRFLNSTGEEFQDTAGIMQPTLVPDDIKAACIRYVGWLDRNADTVGEQERSDWLPPVVESILHSRRAPTLA